MTFFEKHKYDLFVIAAVLLIAGALFGYTILNRTPGAEVVITIDGEEFMTKLAEYGIGVREIKDYEIDEEFFSKI